MLISLGFLHSIFLHCGSFGMPRQSLKSLLLMCVLAVFASPARSQVSSTDAAEDKKNALNWLDRFSRVQVLFHPEDVKKLRDKVEAMSPEDVSKWWKERAPNREVLDSKEWQEAQNWFREFLRVQARYSDEDIRLFQSEAFGKARESVGSLNEVIQNLIAYRQRFRAAAQASDETRQLQLAANEAFRQEQVRQREARWQRPMPQLNLPPPPVPRDERTRANPPLIDSLDAARWMILNQLYPRW
jgi:hypothetical protein